MREMTPTINTTPALLREEEQLPADLARRAQDLARQTMLDPNKPDSVSNLGASSQAKAGQVAEQLLAKVQVKDAGAAGALLSSLTKKLRSVDVKKLSEHSPSKLPFGLSKLVDGIQTWMTGYQGTLTQIDELVTQLSTARQSIVNDVEFLGKLYDQNLALYHELQTWIEVGKIKRLELDEDVIPAAVAKAAASSNPLDSQTVSDLRAHRARLDKRIYDLELTKMARLQNAPKIRLIQGGDASLAEQLQSSVVNGVPLFKENLSMAIVLSRQKEAAQLQQDFSDGFNELVRQGADMMHDNSVMIATQAQRGIVDFETLKHSQEQLIRTVEDVAKIAEDGQKNRETVRQGLTEMEVDLKQRLLK